MSGIYIDNITDDDAENIATLKRTIEFINETKKKGEQKLSIIPVSMMIISEESKIGLGVLPEVLKSKFCTECSKLFTKEPTGEEGDSLIYNSEDIANLKLQEEKDMELILSQVSTNLNYKEVKAVYLNNDRDVVNTIMVLTL
jgi:hypothetical protein